METKFYEQFVKLLAGHAYSYKNDAIGTIEITCDEKFRNAITILAFDQLSPGVSVIINELNVDYNKLIEPFIYVKPESVNHPSHYGGADNPYEVIKVMEEWLTYEEFIGAMKFQQFKYLARAKKKDTEDENYQKATWYANYLTDYIRRKREQKA